MRRAKSFLENFPRSIGAVKCFTGSLCLAKAVSRFACHRSPCLRGPRNFAKRAVNSRISHCAAERLAVSWADASVDLSWA